LRDFSGKSADKIGIFLCDRRYGCKKKRRQPIFLPKHLETRAAVEAHAPDPALKNRLGQAVA
jgi:hypothetical protein